MKISTLVHLDMDHVDRFVSWMYCQHDHTKTLPTKMYKNQLNLTNISLQLTLRKATHTQTQLIYEWTSRPRKKLISSHEKHLWSSLKISPAQEPTNCEEDILPIMVKQQTQNNRNIATNSTDSNWKLPNRILDRYLRWSECLHTYWLTPHKIMNNSSSHMETTNSMDFAV